MMVRYTMVLLLLPGCALGNRQITDEIFPSKPGFIEQSILSRNALKDRLNEPFSARWTGISNPKKSWLAGRFWQKEAYGWTWVANVNAKNVFGGYNGVQQWRFFWNGGRIWAWPWNSIGRHVYNYVDSD